MNNILGERIRILRKEKKITQKELAEMLDLTDTTVTNWEKGKRIPDVETLMFLADYFGVTIDYLAGRTDNRNNKIVQTSFLDENNKKHDVKIEIDSLEELTFKEIQYLIKKIKDLGLDRLLA